GRTPAGGGRKPEAVHHPQPDLVDGRYLPSMQIAKHSSFSRGILEFLRRAGTERSTKRLVAEMFRFLATTFSIERVSLFLVSPEHGRLLPYVSEYASGVVDRDLFEEWRGLNVEDFDVVQRIRAGAEVVMVEDPRDGLPDHVVDRFGNQPFLAFGLRRDGLLLGVLIVEGQPAILRKRQQDLAEFSEYVALALDNARAFEREERRASDAEALLEVGSVLTRTTELIPVLAAVAQNCARVTSFDRCSVFLLDEESDRLIPTMSQFADGHVDDAAWQRFISNSEDAPAAREVMASGEPMALLDPEAHPELLPDSWREPFGVRSLLLLPLTAWNETFGVLVLDRNRREAIPDHQIRIAQGVAAQGAAAIGLTRSLARERAAVTRLQELDNLKTTLVASVSHELRTPLTTIIGFGALLPDYLSDPEALEHVALIQRESAHLEALISNLLLASRLEAGALEYRRDRLDLGDVVTEAVDLIARLFPERQIDLHLAGALTLVTGDQGTLRQVFTNLIENAVKYSPAGTPVEVSADGDGEQIVVTVADRGPGIPLDEREVIFERFRRGKNHAEQGTGIGLYLVRALVAAHGGTVRVSDRLDGSGSIFVTTLPVRSTLGVEEQAA
ncbi:MAG: ATP-binding protein, partial [Acidimicrobiia bacterium]